MVGYSDVNTNNKQSSELKKSNDPFDQSYIELEDISFIDSLLDIDDWVEDNSNPSMADNANFKENANLEKYIEIKKEPEEEAFGSAKFGNLGSAIEEEMSKVSLTSNTCLIDEKQEGQNGDDVSNVVENGDVTGGHENGMKKMEKGEGNGDGGDLDETEESEEETESSSSSSSDDDDGDEGKKKVEGGVEMEEGEIRDSEVEEMIAWSDDEDGNVAKGPIRSKNEVQNLPPVPPVNVTIEPHHQTLSVGVVLSIIGAQVIVEGVENHNPLSEGSILWIAESRSPLGVIDEIFGPVKNPYYVVRYNSESEVPIGIQQGSLISFVPEFADYVLNNNNLYKKGYDASGENDEELSEELEFSDDEKEAEYKKMLKMSKRGLNEQKNGNFKKDKKSRNRIGNWKNDHLRPQATSTSHGFSGVPTGAPGVSPGFGPTPQAQATGTNHGFSGAPVVSPGFGPTPQAQATGTNHGFSGAPMGAPVVSPGFGLTPPAPNFNGPSWTNGFGSIQPQNMGFSPNGYPQNVPFMQQNFTQPPFQNLDLPFHPQFNGQMLPSNFVNFGMVPTFGSWPSNMSQNGFNQSPVGPPMNFMNVLPQGAMMPNGLQMDNNGGMRPPLIQMGNNGGMRPQMDNNGGMRPQMGNNGGMRPQMGNNGGMRPQMDNNGDMRPQMDNNGGVRAQMDNNGGTRPPFVASNVEDSQNRGGRKPFQRGSGRFRGGGRSGGRGGRGGRQSR